MLEQTGWFDTVILRGETLTWKANTWDILSVSSSLPSPISFSEQEAALSQSLQNHRSKNKV